MKTHNAPWYKHDPIASLDALARALGLTKNVLLRVRASANNSYRLQKRPKKNGGVRITYSVAKPLKLVQTRILHRILREVELPTYLLGGLPGKDYLANVQHHCGAKILFGEDVSSFYPSIKTSHVKGCVFRTIVVNGCVDPLFFGVEVRI